MLEGCVVHIHSVQTSHPTLDRFCCISDCRSASEEKTATVFTHRWNGHISGTVAAVVAQLNIVSVV